ncbi:MAG TPA: hypothetical protein VGW38_17080 [Chloroflexota bacterium]|nr:hypothetical protein [Chloroflexota bacterium]
MGGYFSTRLNYERTRQDTAGLLFLDVRAMKRRGVLQRGVLATWQWTRNDGEPAGTIGTYCDSDTLTLQCATRRPGDAGWTPVRDTVPFDTTPCQFGGRFRCRAYHDLAYTSTREDAVERADRRIVTLHAGSRPRRDAACSMCRRNRRGCTGTRTSGWSRSC